MVMQRVVIDEALDHLAPTDPAAIRSRRDLVRVHRAMRTVRIVSQGWQSMVSSERASGLLRILEIGAGDGTLLLDVARYLSPRWPRVQLTLLDRVDIVAPATLTAYAELGWTAHVLNADVLDWTEPPDKDVSSLESSRFLSRWDMVSTALFLHHFEKDQLDLLLAGIASRTDRFFAFEPKRSWQTLAGSHLVGAIGANAVTREDAVLSVHAGFRDHEITARWPQVGSMWKTQEFTAGIFSHCFGARRMGVD